MMKAPLTEFEERPIDRAIERQDAAAAICASHDKTIALVEDLLTQRRELWVRIDEKDVEIRRLQSVIDSLRLRRD
jgi:hypothetical protein